VLDQFPRRGHVSSHDTVTLVLAKPLHGVVPKVIGLPLATARSRIRSRGFVPVIDRFDVGDPGRVLAQSPPPGVAGAERLPLRLVVGRG
jgi:beta-lactam-binding protein with PASTA domain